MPASREIGALATRLQVLNLHHKNGNEMIEMRHINEWAAPRMADFNRYLGYLSRAMNVVIPEQTKPVFESVIERNHLVSLILTSTEYEAIVKEEKELRGARTAVGISKCIDGRLITLWNDGRASKDHETMAGKLETDEVMDPSGCGVRTTLRSERLVEAIKDEVSRGSLLEILVAHTDFHNPTHGCGAMIAAQKNDPDKYPPKTDLVKANLDEHLKAARAIDLLYNEAAEYTEKPLQKRTAITAVYDTHTMGVMLGYGETDTFYTTDIARTMAQNPELYLGKLETSRPENYYAGSIKSDLQKAEKIIENENMIFTLSKALLQENNPFFSQVQNYIGSHSTLSQLSPEQQKALRFYLARTTALQYLSKAYDGIHPYVDHDEVFQGLSSDGPSFGEYLPEQTFCANPNDTEAVAHILTQIALMNRNNRIQPKPYLLFVSGVLSAHQDESSAERARAKNLALFRKIVNDPKIQDAIRSGELLPIPVMIDDKTRDLIAIQNPIGAF